MKNIISNKFTFFDTCGNIIKNVINVNIDPNGEFSMLTYHDDIEDADFTITPDEYTYTNLILMVPGIGYAYCGDIVVLEQFRKKPARFKLNFGWHENKSNQKLFTWYLCEIDKNYKELNNIPIGVKTLYFDDLTNIIGIENKMPGFLPDDLEEF